MVDPTPTRLFAGDDPAWEAWLSGNPRDVYHTAGYHRYAGDRGEGEPYLAVIGDRDRGVAWPYLLRPISEVDGLDESEATDVTSVYGYPGPLAWGVAPGDPFLERAWATLVGLWTEQRVVSVFTRFHPLLENASLLPGSTRRGEEATEALVAVGPTVSIDCSLSDEEASAGYKRALRQHIAAGRRAGLRTEHDERWTALPTFTALYRETMARNGADGYYFFDQADFERLRAALDGHLHLLVTRCDDGVAAAGLFTEHDGIVEAHLVGTSGALRALSPFKVLLDDARRWARERGDRVLHLGGGRGCHEDSLWRFKAEFSPRRHVFHVGRWILDPAAYDELVERRVHDGSDPRAIDPSYFPAYRASRLEGGPSPCGSDR